MAGPVPTYLATQLAAQTAFNVPFGLLTFVNNAITAATADGKFNVTVDCSLFVAEDVSNLRIYLDSLGYKVEYAKGSNNKSLNIDWGEFLDIPGTSVTVFQGTSPWIIAGTVDQGAPGASPWLVSVTNTVTVNQGTSPWVVTGTITTSPDVNVHDSVGNAISSTGTSLDVNVTDFPTTVAVTQSTSPWIVSGTVTATPTGTQDVNLTQVGGAAVTEGQKTMAASLPVVIASDQTGINTELDKSGSGTISANAQTIVATTNGCSSVAFNVRGVYVGAVASQGTTDGTNWVNIYGTQVSNFTVINFLLSVADTLLVPCGGYKQVRLIGVFWTSGTASIEWNAGAGSNEVIGVNPPGTLNNGAETAVAAAAVQVLAANTNRDKLILSNTGAANVRVGTTGVTATTGFRLATGATIVFDAPNCPTNAVFAIREGLVNSIVLAQEII